MVRKQILLLCGGGGTEHEISLISAKYVEEILIEVADFEVIWVEIGKDNKWRSRDDRICELRSNGSLLYGDGQVSEIDLVVPCIHGPPGETGDIQSIFELYRIPYLGSGPETSKICFNKVTSKLWLSSLEIPNTPYIFLSSPKELDQAKRAFDQWGPLFVKAASQGSSVGCYMVTTKDNLEYTIVEAFQYSPYVLIEKSCIGRELEVSVYQYNDVIIATDPGEIICPTSFYSYQEKYSPASKTKTELQAKNLDHDTLEKIKNYSLKVFDALRIKNLCRIDFFYTKSKEIYLNEINTFPGLTPISMFPKMMENHGESFASFLDQSIRKELCNSGK